MSNRKRYFLIAAAAIVAVVTVGGIALYRSLASQVNLVGMLARGGTATVAIPEGFAVNVFADGLDGPRFIKFDSQGRLFVAERGADRIVILADEDGDGVADSRSVFAAELDNPHSIVLHEGAWYVGVPKGVIRLEDRNGDGTAESVTKLVNDYPTSGHNTRTVEFLPDGQMVVSIGSSCNVCDEDDPRRAAVVAYSSSEADGERAYASGLRNAVGLAIHPATGELWATDNGRDLMGDDLPPDSIYIVTEGADYGWPRCHAGTVSDPEYGFPGACDDAVAPVVDLQAHSAPLGLVFYDGGTFPEEYRGDLFVAFHGSWNRSVPTGYKVVRLPFRGTQPGSEVVDFATGWLGADLETVTGRPVGLAVGPDGALYVSDDSAGIIYRIQYEG